MCKSKKIFALSRSFFLRVFCIACTLLGCSSEPELTDLIPQRMELVGEFSYFEEAQTTITRQFRVRVITKDAKPVPNVSVFFTLVMGTASLSSDVVLTDQEGIAVLNVAAGPEAQMIQVNANVPALENPSISFFLTIAAQVPAAVEIVSGDFQEILAGFTLPDQLRVRVIDAFGNPVKGIPVDFTVDSNGGSIKTDFSQLITDNDGISFATCNVGVAHPINRITASVGGSFPVVFTAYSLLPVTVSPIKSTQDAANLSWSETVNPTFARYSIMRSPVGFSNYIEVGAVTDAAITSFADQSAETGRAYSYYVRVITARNNFVDSGDRTGERGKFIDLKNESDFADVTMSPDKSTLYIAKLWSKRILIVSTDPFQKTDSLSLSESPYALAVSSDQSKLYVALYGLPRFQVIDLASKTVLQEVDLQSVLDATAIGDIYQTADGQLFASSYGGFVAKINESDNYSAIRVASDKYFSSSSPTFLADYGNFLYMEESHLTPNSLFKLDLSNAAAPVVSEDIHGTVRGTRGAALTPDGTYLYLTSGQVVSTSNLKPTDELNGPTLYSLQVSTLHLFGCFYGGSYNTWKLNRLNRISQTIEKTIPLGFNSLRLFLSADEENAFLVSVPDTPYYTVRIYKVNLSN